MDSDDKKLTIKDVARLAGVSKGTVDRVVHNRGEVSEKSRLKVLEVISSMGYRPNIYASMLASRRRYLIACLIPSYLPGEFWELVSNGIERARRDEGNYNVAVEVFHYVQYDKESFRGTCSALLEKKPDAVIMAPMFPESAREFSRELTSRNIPFALIDSRLENLPYLAYFGMPMYHSGYQGAALLFDGYDGPAVVFSIEHPYRRDNPTSRRVRGFMAWVEENRPGTAIHEEFLRPYDTAHNTRSMDRFFEEHPDVTSIITFNSRVHMIADYLRRRDPGRYRLIGYDMLARNIEALREGYCKYLITNKTEMQVYNGIHALHDYLAFHKPPPLRDNYSSIDILTPHNVDYYFKEQS